MAETTLVGVRVHSWHWFKFKRWAEHIGQPLGLALTDALKVYLDSEKVPPELTTIWLEEYRIAGVKSDAVV